MDGEWKEQIASKDKGYINNDARFCVPMPWILSKVYGRRYSAVRQVWTGKVGLQMPTW